MISVILFEMGKHSDFRLSFFQIVGAWRDCTVVTKLMKNFKSLYRFGGRWILSNISRSITWSLFTVKASYLVKWSISTWSFMWWCQLIDWLKFENSPQFGTLTPTSSWLMLGPRSLPSSMNAQRLSALAELCEWFVTMAIEARGWRRRIFRHNTPDNFAYCPSDK